MFCYILLCFAMFCSVAWACAWVSGPGFLAYIGAWACAYFSNVFAWPWASGPGILAHVVAWACAYFPNVFAWAWASVPGFLACIGAWGYANRYKFVRASGGAILGTQRYMSQQFLVIFSRTSGGAVLVHNNTFRSSF